VILNLHAVIPGSLANGPGRRFAVWFQGCSKACDGCFNPDTHDFAPRFPVDVRDLVSQIAAQKNVEGLSVSGGEPFEQADGLLELLRRTRKEAECGLLPPEFSILVFSGLTIEAIRTLPKGQEILDLVDVLIDGSYDAEKAAPPGSFVSSTNQRVHLLTSRHAMNDFRTLPEAEVIIGADGNITCSGVNSIFP